MAEKIINTELSQPDQISVKIVLLKIGSLRRYLLMQWKILLLSIIIGALIGVLYATFKKTIYTAEFTFVLQDSNADGKGLGQYSALASLAGLDAGSSSGLFSGDNIIELYKSRLMLSKTLLTSSTFAGKEELLIDRYIKINKLRDSWKGKPNLSQVRFDTTKAKFGMVQDSLVIAFVNDINKNYLNVDKPDKKLSIISVKIKSIDPLFSKAFTETLVRNVNQFFIQTKTKGSLQNVKLFQRQVDSIRTILNSSIAGSANAQDANPDANPLMQTLKVPSQKRQVDIQANSAIYGEAVKNLEIARASIANETPLIQVLDKPMLPLPNDKVSRFKSAIVGGIIAFIVITFVIISRKVYKKIIS